LADERTGIGAENGGSDTPQSGSALAPGLLRRRTSNAATAILEIEALANISSAGAIYVAAARQVISAFGLDWACSVRHTNDLLRCKVS
jgi:hypothetical protein